MKDPTEIELGDGTKVQLSFTYARKKAKGIINPNEGLKNFLADLTLEPQNSIAAEIHFQQFVLSYGGASETIKEFLEKHTKNVSMNVWVDGNFSLEWYSQARKMAGLYTVFKNAKSVYVERPWWYKTRENIEARTYDNNFDKLHTKNTYIAYRKASQNEDRFFITTGSLNYSANGISNKELHFVIDTPSSKFVDLMRAQAKFIETEGYLRPIDDAALFRKIKSTSKKMAGVSIKDEAHVFEAFDDFLKVLNKGKEQFVMNSLMMSPFSELSDDSSFQWVNSLGTFLEDVGAEKAAGPLKVDLKKNLNEVQKFYPSVSSVEILLNLSEQSENPDPKLRVAILDLFNKN